MRHKSLLILLVAILFGCKDKFLDVKPDDSLVIPTTLNDLQALLDNEEYMNGYTSRGPHPGLLFAGTDEYYITNDRYKGFTYQYIRNAYTWQNVNLYAGLEKVNDWASPYRTIYYANIVLEGLKSISVTSQNENAYNNAKGSALFYRAFTNYELAQAFAQPYNAGTADADLGIPIRLTADVSEHLDRATVRETYDRIIGDLTEAEALLPDKPLVNSRPSKAAVYALEARMYLSMEQYDLALKNAKACLSIKNDLLDFNSLSASASYPMPARISNPEIILSGAVNQEPLGGQLVGLTTALIDSALYSLYEDNDLRKTVCYKAGSVVKSKIYKGSYTKGSLAFAGLATDEIYLVEAECLARTGAADAAMDVLNTLLKTRWIHDTFQPLAALGPDDALQRILLERRKELVMRGTRWTDLRRLNRDSRFAVTISRNIDGKISTLPPNDKRYTWQIPDDVISFNPGMKQNPL